MRGENCGWWALPPVSLWHCSDALDEDEFCAPGGLLTNPPIRFPFRAPAALNLPTTLHVCQCLMLNFHLDSSVSRRRSLQRFKLGTRPWECLFRAFHSFWINPFSFLTQSVSPVLPSWLLKSPALRKLPNWGGCLCYFLALKSTPILLAFPGFPRARSTVTGELQHCSHGSGIMCLSERLVHWGGLIAL